MNVTPDTWWLVYVFIFTVDVVEEESSITSLHLYRRVSNNRPEIKQGPLKT
jgi:hypothetical protein